LKEVFKMDPRIREFTESNAGAAQFVSRYGEVSASPAVQQAYQDWVLADFREASIMRGVRMEGVEEGIEKGIEKTARKMFDKGWSIETIIEGTGLSKEQVESLR
jgi:predicted transposase/invertase (TIGR01784 family)